MQKSPMFLLKNTPNRIVFPRLFDHKCLPTSELAPNCQYKKLLVIKKLLEKPSGVSRGARGGGYSPPLSPKILRKNKKQQVAYDFSTFLVILLD